MSRAKISLTLVASGILAFLLSAQPEARDGKKAGSVKRVRVAAVESAATSRDVRLTGITRAARRGRLAFTLGGRLAARPVEVGDRVQKGQELARLDSRELANAERSAEAAHAELEERLAQARRDQDRASRLLAAKAATQEEVEQASSTVETLESSLASSQASLAEARRRVGEARLVAPFSGVVTEVLLEPGEHTVAGRDILILAGDGELEVEVEVPETLVPLLSRGAEVWVEMPAMGRGAEGRIQSLGLTSLGPGRLFPVVASVEVEGAVAGMTAEVVVRLENAAAITLPVEAVVDPGGRRPVVFRVRDGVVERVEVRVGALLDERIVVDGALAPGESVVVGGQRGLLDGERVEVLP